jgi:hypothetical protein
MYTEHNYACGSLILFKELSTRSRIAFHSSTRGVPVVWDANTEPINKADTMMRTHINIIIFLLTFIFLLALLLSCFSIFTAKGFLNINVLLKSKYYLFKNILF